MYSSMQSHHASTFRYIPAVSKPVSPERVAEVLADEWKLFTKNTKGSEAESKRAFESLPLGVTSSFQHWDPYPISIASAPLAAAARTASVAATCTHAVPGRHRPRALRRPQPRGRTTARGVPDDGRTS